MQPTFILTRAFAISALFAGAAPLAQAAPIYTTTSCASGASCSSSSLPSLWSFFAALVPTGSSSGPVNVFDNVYPEDSFHFATHSSEPPAADRETIAVVVVMEKTCTDGSCEGSFFKRDDVEIAAREPERVEERADHIEIAAREPERVEERAEDVDIIIREPVELADRDAEPEPICFGLAYCKREPESK